MDIFLNFKCFLGFTIFSALICALIIFVCINSEYTFSSTIRKIAWLYAFPLVVATLVCAKTFYSFQNNIDLYAFSSTLFISTIIGNLVGLAAIDLKYNGVYDDLLMATVFLALAYVATNIGNDPEFNYSNIKSYYPILPPILFGLSIYLVGYIVSKSKDRDSLGDADAYIAVVMGCMLGFVWSMAAMFVGCLSAIIYQFAKADKEQDEIPFIPFLSSATIIIFLNLPLSN